MRRNDLSKIGELFFGRDEALPVELGKLLAFLCRDIEKVDQSSVEYAGYSIRGLAKKYGIGHRTLTWRIKNGWSMEKALEKPVRPWKKPQ